MISPVRPADSSESRNAATLPTSPVVTFRRSGEFSSTYLRILLNPAIPLAARVLIGPAQLGEERRDLGVARDVTGEDQRASELRGHLRDAVLEAFVLVGERELGALAPGGSGDAVGNRAIGEQARDQHALAREETHLVFRLSGARSRDCSGFGSSQIMRPGYRNHSLPK